MPKLTLAPIISGYSTVAAINSNSDLIESALENTISRDGSTPNSMGADLDLNGHRLLNLPSPAGSTDAVRLQDLQAASVVTQFPSQGGNSGKFLKTDGTAVSWATPSLSLSTISNSAITGGSISGGTAITGVTIDSSPIGASTPSSGRFTTLAATGAVTLVDDNTSFVDNTDPTRIVKLELGSMPIGTTVITPAPYAVRLGNLPPGIGPLPYSGTSAPTGWLFCDQDVSRSTYSDLFAVIGTTYGVGDGVTTFGLPRTAGRSMVGAGTGTVVASGTNTEVDTTADTFTVAANSDKWITGQPVVFSLSGGTITGLTSGVTYYVIRASATTVKLAASLGNSQNGNAIDLTAKSSPVWTLTRTFTTRTAGVDGGEEQHAMSSSELIAHNHPGSTFPASSSSSPGIYAFHGDAFEGNRAISIGTSGGAASMNIMNPYLVTKMIISY